MKPSFDPIFQALKKLSSYPLYWQHVKGLHNPFILATCQRFT